jgi:hypothetical protein
MLIDVGSPKTKLMGQFPGPRSLSRVYARANHRSEMWMKLRSDWL